jgi:hypothetical protein
MKLQKPENENYAATVVALQSIVPLEGSDNIVGTPLFGFQAIVGKDSQPGDLGIVFPAESQLSVEYAKENNLFRHGDLNRDESAKGYLEDNRRVKAMKFRGHRSDCLFMPITSLSYIKGLKLEELKEGDTFDKLGDHNICNKYVVKRTRNEARLEKNKEKFIRVDKKFMPEHYDSDQYYRNSDVIPPERLITVTQKLHGTSIRVGHTVVRNRLGVRARLAKLIGVKVQEHSMDYVFGSRKVIKDVNNPNQNHFYSTDIWTEEGAKLTGKIPENFLLFGELIGWTPEGNPIQKNYTYQVPEKTCDLYIYRVAFINAQGFVCDLAWDQVKEFCRDRDIRTVPELWRGPHKEFVVEDFIDTKYHEQGYPGAVPLDKASPVDEGVCIRADGIAPYILKAKGPEFYAHETKMLDEEALDVEAEESTE